MQGDALLRSQLVLQLAASVFPLSAPVCLLDKYGRRRGVALSICHFVVLGLRPEIACICD